MRIKTTTFLFNKHLKNIYYVVDTIIESKVIDTL